MITALAARKLSQAEAIRLATEKSVHSRNRYADQVAVDLGAALGDAEAQVRTAILRYKTLGSLPDNKLAALKGLEKLQAEVHDVLASLKKDQTLRFRRSVKAAFRMGIFDGISEFASAQLPFYKDLTAEGIEKLGTQVFTLVDRQAIDFLTNYNLVLLGDVHRELADGIKRTLLSGITTGKGVEGIVRDLGKVVKNPESFRHAGKRVFPNAQKRLEVIARTEVLRAHNQGRIKFHREVGVQRLEWMAMGDERVCSVCGPLDGKTFDAEKFPPIPRHPQCRCQSLPAWPLVVCGGILGAVASSEVQTPAPACLLPPHALEQRAKAQAAATKKLDSAFASGDPTQLAALTVKELQTLAKANGVSVARTKAEHLKLLDLAEPGIDHSDIGGQALSAKLKFHGIGALHTKEELVALLAQKQAALAQAQQIAQQLVKVPAAEGLDGLSVVHLQELAKAKGIPISLTKQDVVDLLDELEPGIDHSGLTGAALAEAKKKLGLTPLKNKKQLIAALEKAAGHEMAEMVKEEAVSAAQNLTIENAKATLVDASAGVVVPPSPASYQDFLAAVTKAEKAIAGGGQLPQAFLEEHAKALALKTKLFFDQVAAMKLTELKDLAKITKVKQWQWASKDELVLLFTEVDPSKIEATKASIAAKQKVWYAKYGGGKKAGKPASAPDAPPVLPTPPVRPLPVAPKLVPSPDPLPAVLSFPRSGSAFEKADLAWAQAGAPERFRFLEVAKIEGAHHKEFWVDEKGAKWLFKPAGGPAEVFRAHGDEAAYRIGRLVDPEAIEVRVITLGGKTGSIQRWRTDLDTKFDFRDIGPENISPSELAQVQREHVIDWLLSNHDAHPKQFLRTKDGRVLGIDKGQLYKFLGSDRLDPAYHPNGVHGETEPFYNSILRAAKQGKVKLDPEATLRAILEVEKIPDDDFLSLLDPYARGRFGKNDAGRRAFLDLALARKKNLRRDFEGLFADVLGEKGFRFGGAETLATARRLGSAEKALLEEVEEHGWQGKVLPFDEGDIEDQNALLWVETAAGQPRTVLKMKVRPEAEEKFLPKLRKALPDGAGARVGDPLPEDSFSEKILAAVKTVNTHATDGNYNLGKLDDARKLRASLEKLRGSPDPDLDAMATTYLTWLDRVEAAVAQKAGISGEKFSAYLKKFATKQGPSTAPFKVRRGKVLHPRRVVENGRLVAPGELVDNRALFGANSIAGGEQFEVEFPDGVRIVYRPWNSPNPYAQQGELEVFLPGRANAGTLESAMDRLDSLGISSRVADAADAELLYLQKQAYVSKVHTEAGYKTLLGDLEKSGASRDERIAALRGFWEKKLGVKDITKASGYQPIGEYQLACRARKGGAGYRHQYRFDISDEDLEKKMAGYALHHSVTGGKSLPNVLESLLDQSGAFVSTVEKLRVGVPISGMSPVSDMASGGASYFFTRIEKLTPGAKPPHVGFFFKKRLLRRMDAISYGSDKYGRVTDNHVTENRGSGPEQWKRFADSGGNETIFKYSVTLLDNIEIIAVKNATERKTVIDIFKKRGILKLPDGRSIDDIVVARS